ncbi:MAG TPA: propionyl-CoA carboxylase [Myxococcales bacterium]|nr:propionyl-CoA carboxylase [Myxococcales bacterium]
MSWQDEVDGIEARSKLAKKMGGDEAVARQHARGRMTIRERIDALADAGSFREEGPLAGFGELDDEGRLKQFTPGNYVLGVAQLDGNPVVVGGEDFTQRGGSPTPSGLRKSVYAEELALRYRLPLVRFLEGGGGSVTGTGGKGSSAPRPMGDPVYAPSRFKSMADALECAPVVSAAVGAVAGLPAARLAASHFSVMTRNTSQVLVAGPAVVERALGEKLTKEELGGAKIHLRSGLVDNVAEDEPGVIDQIRRFLSYLPRNASEMPARSNTETIGSDDPLRQDESLLEIVPRERRKIYKMRRIVESVVDQNSFFEMTALYGRSQITGLARLNGWPVGIWANDPRFYGGAMTAHGAQKVRRFIELCDRFHLPMVALVDEPGFMIGSASEKAATIRYGVDTICATVRSKVPWVSVIVRKTYGVAAAAHFGPAGEVYAWPSAEGGALPIEGGVAVAFRREIEAAPDPEARRQELEAQFLGRQNPFARAEAFGVHNVIDPRQTRPALCQWIELARPVLEQAVLGTRMDAPG